MTVIPQHGHPVLATAVPVAITALLHAAISTAIIAAVRPDVPYLVPYWLLTVAAPSVCWMLLVLGRAASWRRASAFWHGASGGIVVLLAFVVAFWIYVGDVSVRGIARGLPLALVYSSWVLLACAIGVAMLVRLLSGRRDEPVEAAVEAAVEH